MSSVSLSSSARSCSQCSQIPKDPVKRCSRCNLVAYCSKECQVQAWKIHKKVCQSLASLSLVEEKSSALEKTRSEPNSKQEIKTLIKEIQDQYSKTFRSIEEHEYNEVMFLGFLQRRDHAVDQRIKHFSRAKPFVGEARKVVCLGSGFGECVEGMIRVFQDSLENITGYEKRKEYAEISREYFNPEKVTIVAEDFMEAVFPEKADVFVVYESINELPPRNFPLLLKKIHSSLEKEGKLLISLTLANEEMKDPLSKKFKPGYSNACIFPSPQNVSQIFKLNQFSPLAILKHSSGVLGEKVHFIFKKENE